MAVKKRKLKWGRIIGAVLLVLAAVAALRSCNAKRQAEAEPVATPTPTIVPTPTPEPTIDPAVFTDTDSLLLVANKKHKLPDGYVPSDLRVVNIRSTATCTMRSEAADAIEKMAEAAGEDGVVLCISSAFRDEGYQSSLYYGYVARSGQASADTYSSRPGYSDHQTGLCADFVENGGGMDGINFADEFENTASGKWLAEHAVEYGFIMRYPKGKDAVTGYKYEPWHFRYIGVEEAGKLKDAGEDMTFEEFFGVPGGDYED